MSAVDSRNASASAKPDADGGAANVGEARILSAVFEVLDRANIRYCVLHGYDGFPDRIGSDVDCIIDRTVTPRRLLKVLHDSRARIGADVVRCRGYHIVLAGRGADGTLAVVTLDLAVDAELDGVRFCDGADLLGRRRRHGSFWIPAPDHEFGCYLARSVVKGRLDPTRTRKLETLYRADASGCERQLERLFPGDGALLIDEAARSGDWREVSAQRNVLRKNLVTRERRHHPLRSLSGRLRGMVGMVVRLVRPEGVYVAFLGPDGAGKSSAIDGIDTALRNVFEGSECFGFTPAPMHRLLHGDYGANAMPHAAPPRSYLLSVARASIYWFGYYTAGYLVRHVALARTKLVVSDRHYVDVLVDQARYRYGGPRWLLRLIWRLIPKPDLVVLLDAPPEVLQARKQEVPFAETARQRAAYVSLVSELREGRIVNAAQPLLRVVADVSDIVLAHMAASVARRFGLESVRAVAAESPVSLVAPQRVGRAEALRE